MEDFGFTQLRSSNNYLWNKICQL